MAICALAAHITGCTALSDFDVHQCELDVDCGVEGGAAICQQSRCVPGCVDNRQCAALNPQLPLCQARGGSCVSMISDGPECYAASPYDVSSMDALTAQDLILIGAFAPSLASASWLTLQLGASEINAAGGLPGPNGQRPVLVALCDDSLPVEAMLHLVDGLHVRGIIASLEDAALRAAMAEVALDSTLLLSPNGSNTRPSELAPSSGLLWYLGAEYVDVLSAYGSLIDRVRADVAARRGPDARPRWASVASGAAEDQTLARGVQELLRQAGVDVSAEDPAGPYQNFNVFGDAAFVPDEELQRLARYEPDVLLFFGGGVYELATSNPLDDMLRQRATILRAIEANARLTSGAPPLYILGPRNVEELAPRRLAMESSSFRARAFALGANRARDDVVASALDARFASSFPNADPRTGLRAAPDIYDALYALAYAVAAAELASPLPSDAAELSAGLSAVTDTVAERVDVGPDGLPAAMDHLAAATAFNLFTTSGPIAFDAVQHARPGQGYAYCWNPSGAATVAASLDVESGAFEPSGEPCARTFPGAQP